MSNQPKLGLALGGGFLRGVAHIGVLDVLEREGIQVDLVAGTSAGSIIAALYARGGLTPAEMEQVALGLTTKDVFDTGSTICNLVLLGGKVVTDLFRLSFPFRSPLGLMRGNRLERLVNDWVGSTRVFSQMQKNLAITAVDINTGTLVVFMADGFRTRTVIPSEDTVIMDEIGVARAVRASCSVPGLFEPVSIDGRLLVDGGIRNNVPADVVRQMGADVVVAVDVGYDGQACRSVTNIIEILSQSLDIMGTEGVVPRLEKHADVVIRPIIKDVAPWNFNQIGYCIRQGQLAGLAAIPALRQALGL